MSAEPAPLRAVTGELPQTYDQALQALGEVEGAYRELEFRHRAALSQIAQMKKDREKEARGSQLWLVAERLFTVWATLTKPSSLKKPRVAFSYRRFEAIEPYLRDLLDDEGQLKPEFESAPATLLEGQAVIGPPRDAFEECAAAIVGRVHDHFQTTRANGSTKHHWGWDAIIFKNDDSMRESMARRPQNWRALLAGADPGPVERGPRAL